jgi:hypothetical protein
MLGVAIRARQSEWRWLLQLASRAKNQRSDPNGWLVLFALALRSRMLAELPAAGDRAALRTATADAERSDAAEPDDACGSSGCEDRRQYRKRKKMASTGGAGTCGGADRQEASLPTRPVQYVQNGAFGKRRRGRKTVNANSASIWPHL